MTTRAYVNLLRFYLPSGAEAAFSKYQNFFVDSSFSYGDTSYAYLPFACATGAGASGGERTGETLGLGLDTLSASIATEAVAADWRARLETVLLDSLTDEAIRTFTVEWWNCNSYTQRPGQLLIDLRSPFDAVRNQYPGRVLTQILVGTMPSTGNIIVGN